MDLGRRGGVDLIRRAQYGRAILPDSFEAEQYDLVTVGALTIFVQSAAHQASGFQRAGTFRAPACRTCRSACSVGCSTPARAATPLDDGHRAHLQLRWQELFHRPDGREVPEGDVVFAVPLTTDVKMGDELTYGTKTCYGITAMAGVRSVLHAGEGLMARR